MQFSPFTFVGPDVLFSTLFWNTFLHKRPGFTPIKGERSNFIFSPCCDFLFPYYMMLYYVWFLKLLLLILFPFCMYTVLSPFWGTYGRHKYLSWSLCWNYTVMHILHVVFPRDESEYFLAGWRQPEEQWHPWANYLATAACIHYAASAWKQLRLQSRSVYGGHSAVINQH